MREVKGDIESIEKSNKVANKLKNTWVLWNSEVCKGGTIVKVEQIVIYHEILQKRPEKNYK